MKKVYHSSTNQNIKKFIPKKSTHGKEWVYAAKDLSISAVFLSTYGGDFTCCVGRDEESGKVYICERFKGAFDLRYSNKKGSIYVLPGDTFVEGQTSWFEEVVSMESVIPIKEIKINDVKEYLLKLQDEHKLIIKYYPDKIDGIPEDDEDLVHRGIVWTRSSGEEIIERIKNFHPNLVERVISGLNEGKYL